MSSSSGHYSPSGSIIDINERRKAQNRLAQRNYRTRQKLRLKLAEAVLFNMPQFQSAMAVTGPKQSQLDRLLPAVVRRLDGGDELHSASSGCGADEVESRDTQHTPPNSNTTSMAPAGSEAGNGSTQGQSAQANPPPSVALSSLSHHLDPANMHFDFGSGSGIDIGVGGSALDPAFNPSEWINIDYPSTSHVLLPTTATPALDAASGNIAVAAPTAKQGVLSHKAVPPLVDAHFHGETERMETPQRGLLDASPPSSISPSSSTQPPSLTASPTAVTTITERYSPFPCSPGSSRLSRPNTGMDVIDPLLRGESIGSFSTVAESASLARDIFEATSPLSTAFSLGDLDIARLLVRSGANIDVPDAKGRTPLHSAVDRGDATLARALLDFGADVLTADKDGMRVLHTAIENDDREMVRLLLGWCQGQSQGGEETQAAGLTQDRDVDPDTNSQGGRDLLQRFINAQEGRGLTGVHLSVLLQRVEILKLLLEYGADVNIGCD